MDLSRVKVILTVKIAGVLSVKSLTSKPVIIKLDYTHKNDPDISYTEYNPDVYNRVRELHVCFVTLNRLNSECELCLEKM